MKNGRKTSSSKNSQNAEKKHSELVKHTYLQDHWVLLHFVAIFTFSIVVGLVAMHAAIVFHQWQHGYGFFMSSGVAMDQHFRDRVLKQYGQAGLDQFESLAKYGVMKVNTSFYVK